MTKAFKELDPELVHKLLEGHENILTPAIEREQAFLRNIPCPSCGKFETEARVDARRPFAHGQLLANKILVCLSCKAEFEPHTRVISRAPTAV